MVQQFANSCSYQISCLMKIKILMITSKQASPLKQKPKQKQQKLAPTKSHYQYNSKLYDLNLNPTGTATSAAISTTTINSTSNTSFDQKLGVTRAQDPVALAMINALEQIDGVKPDVSLSLEKNQSNNRSMSDLRRSAMSTSKRMLGKDKDKLVKDVKELVKFPPIRKISNPQQTINPKTEEIFYQSKVERGFRLKQNTYLMNLARQHFLQSVEAIKIGKNLKLPENPKVINLHKKNPKFKTIFLDLDETLIHCDQSSNNYTVKLNFPVEGGSTISAGIRVRPFCQQFIQELSSFAEVIIFTASSPSYADVVLNYLDPKKKYFAHRLYRQHCTLEKGFYTKDLRTVNRRPQDVAIVDNSAFSFMTQPEHGIPVLPYYHFAKDKQLLSLLKFLKQLVEEADMRQKIKQTFFWEKYASSQEDPRTILTKNFTNA